MTTPDPVGLREALTPDAVATIGRSEYRKKVLTSISDATFPPGTVYQTPEGLRAEDEDTRCAWDVQGGIYPIRESVFQASYELVALATPAPLDEGETSARDGEARGIEGCIAIVEQSLATVRGEYEDNPESRVMPTSIAAREGILALLRGYRDRLNREAGQ